MAGRRVSGFFSEHCDAIFGKSDHFSEILISADLLSVLYASSATDRPEFKKESVFWV